jgi:hypothetical protein
MVNEDTLDLIASVAVWSNHGLFIYASEGTLPPRGELEYAGEGESVYYRASHLKDIKQELGSRISQALTLAILATRA